MPSPRKEQRRQLSTGLPRLPPLTPPSASVVEELGEEEVIEEETVVETVQVEEETVYVEEETVYEVVEETEYEEEEVEEEETLSPTSPIRKAKRQAQSAQPSQRPSRQEAVSLTKERVLTLADGTRVKEKETIFVDDSKLYQTTLYYRTKSFKDLRLPYKSRTNLYIDISIVGIIFSCFVLPLLLAFISWAIAN